MFINTKIEIEITTALNAIENSAAHKTTPTPFADKLAIIRALPPREKRNIIVSDPEARKIVKYLDFQ